MTTKAGSMHCGTSYRRNHRTLLHNDPECRFRSWTYHSFALEIAIRIRSIHVHVGHQMDKRFIPYLRSTKDLSGGNPNLWVQQYFQVWFWESYDCEELRSSYNTRMRYAESA